MHMALLHVVGSRLSGKSLQVCPQASSKTVARMNAVAVIPILVLATRQNTQNPPETSISRGAQIWNAGRLHHLR